MKPTPRFFSSAFCIVKGSKCSSSSGGGGSSRATVLMNVDLGADADGRPQAKIKQEAPSENQTGRPKKRIVSGGSVRDGNLRQKKNLAMSRCAGAALRQLQRARRKLQRGSDQAAKKQAPQKPPREHVYKNFLMAARLVRTLQTAKANVTAARQQQRQGCRRRPWRTRRRQQHLHARLTASRWLLSSRRRRRRETGAGTAAASAAPRHRR